MKKTLAGLLGSAILCIGLLTSTANAAEPMDQGAGEDGRLTREHLLQVGNPLELGNSTFYQRRDTPVFADPKCKYALDLIKTADGVRTRVYYDRQGNVYPVDDVLKEHYYYVFPFYEGLAAVIKLDNDAPTEPVDKRFQLGYVNTAGEEVIPCQYSVIPDCYSQGYLASRFKNGYAYVLRGEDGYKSFDTTVRGSIAKIDAQGNIVSEWTYRDNIMSTNIWFNRNKEPVFQELQLTDFFTDYSSPYTTLATISDIGLTTLFDVPLTCDAAVVPMEKAGSYNDWTGFVVPASNLGLTKTTAVTRYTAARPVFDGAFGADNGFFVTGNVYNSSNTSTAGRWGIVTAYKDKSQKYVFGDVSIIEYTVPANGQTNVGFHTLSPVAEYTFAKVAKLNENCRFIYVSLNADTDYNQFMQEITSIGCVLERKTPFGELSSYSYFERPVHNNEATNWMNQNFAAALK